MKKLILLSMGLLLLFGLTIECFAQVNTKTVVYYFWSAPRCISCKKIENYTQEAVNENFSKELKDGSMEFKVVDYSKNETFKKKYGLYTKAVILSKVKDGKEIKHKNLDKVWLKLSNKADFKNYIKTEIEKFNK